jgi:hypothetical protein
MRLRQGPATPRRTNATRGKPTCAPRPETCGARASKHQLQRAACRIENEVEVGALGHLGERLEVRVSGGQRSDNLGLVRLFLLLRSWPSGQRARERKRGDDERRPGAPDPFARDVTTEHDDQKM